jgi:hypothetical protein
MPLIAAATLHVCMAFFYLNVFLSAAAIKSSQSSCVALLASAVCRLGQKVGDLRKKGSEFWGEVVWWLGLPMHALSQWIDEALMMHLLESSAIATCILLPRWCSLLLVVCAYICIW